MAIVSSRIVGLNENVSTYDFAGADYVEGELNLWEADTDYDLVTATTTEVIEVEIGLFYDTMWMEGATTSADYPRYPRPAPGASHLDVAPGIPNIDGSVASFKTGGPGSASNSFRVGDGNGFSQIQDFVGTQNLPDFATPSVFVANNECAMVGLMVNRPEQLGGADLPSFFLATDAVMVNCLSVQPVGGTAAGVRIDGGLGFPKQGHVYNSTFIGGSSGLLSASGQVMFSTNNLVSGATSAYAGAGTITSTTSGSDGASGDFQNQTYLFKNTGGDDYHLLAGSDGIGQGTDLSAGTIYFQGFNDDIDDQERI